MKKILYLVISILLFAGCTQLSNTPTKRAEEFFKKYQTLDMEVLNDLDDVILKDVSLSTTQQDTYRDVMKRHYQNLTYEIKDETIDGNEAIVEAEITVTNFGKIIKETDSYMINNMEEFTDETGDFSILKFNDYRLEQLKSTKDKVKYTVYLHFKLENENWVVGDIEPITYDKINGLYIN